MPNVTSAIPRRQNTSSGRPKKRLPVRYILVILLTIIVCIVLWTVAGKEKHDPASGKTTAQQFNTKQYSVRDPSSPWVVVNKQRPLNPTQYAPADLTAPNVPLKAKAGAMETELNATTAKALEELVSGAKANGVDLMLVSGYRSYNFQEDLFDYYVRTDGRVKAEQQSARPGYSEHQTGWAADVGAVSRTCEIEICFGDTPEGTWVAANAHTYGFIIRYPKDQTPTTGYEYEPWHLRYVGKTLAAEMHRTQTPTLEEFFGLPPAPSY